MALGGKGGSGRPRKPRMLKLLQGTLQPCRDTPNEPQYPDASLEPPAYLDAAERKHWDFIAPLLASVRILTEADRTALSRYCVLQQAFVETKKLLKKDEYALDRLLKINVQLRGVESDFGLSPASRSRIHAKPVEKDDTEAKKEKRFFG